MNSTECQVNSGSSYQITPEQVRRDNTDLFRYSKVLDKALRKERFSKAKPDRFVDYCEAAGILGLSDPFPDLDFQLDLEKFISTLERTDAHILRLFLFKLNQTEIAQEIGMCQATVCNRLKSLKERFAEFYQS